MDDYSLLVQHVKYAKRLPTPASDAVLCTSILYLLCSYISMMYIHSNNPSMEPRSSISPLTRIHAYTVHKLAVLRTEYSGSTCLGLEHIIYWM